MPHSAEDIRASYPVPVFNFIVDIDGDVIPFKSVSGLNVNYPKIIYRDGMRGLFIMPGLYEPPEITFTKGVFSGQCRLYEWLNTVNFNEVDKKDVLVSLTDPSGERPILSWTLVNAFPTGINAPDLNADSNEVATISMTLACDRVMANCLN